MSSLSSESMDIVVSFILCIMYEPMVTEAGFRSSLHLKMVFTGTMLSVHELLRNRVLLGPPPPLPSVMTKLAHTGSGKVWWIKGKTDQRPSDRKGSSSLLIPWKGRQNRKAGKELKTAYRLRGIYSLAQDSFTREPGEVFLTHVTPSHHQMYKGENSWVCWGYVSELKHHFNFFHFSPFLTLREHGAQWSLASRILRDKLAASARSLLLSSYATWLVQLVPQWSPSLHLLASPLPFLQDVKNLQ